MFPVLWFQCLMADANCFSYKEHKKLQIDSTRKCSRVFILYLLASLWLYMYITVISNLSDMNNTRKAIFEVKHILPSAGIFIACRGP